MDLHRYPPVSPPSVRFLDTIVSSNRTLRGKCLAGQGGGAALSASDAICFITLSYSFSRVGFEAFPPTTPSRQLADLWGDGPLSGGLPDLSCLKAVVFGLFSRPH
jgi:hypothetical protein